MAAKAYTPRSEISSAKAVVKKVGPRLMWFIWIVLGAGTLVTTVDYVRPGQIAVVMNNLTRTATLKLTDGVVMHAPLGITRVYILDKTQQTEWMAGEQGVGDRGGVDNIRVKTTDGTNVFVDVELLYNIVPAMAETVIRTFGKGDNFKLGFVRSFARSEVRDALGRLSLMETTEAGNRQSKAEEARMRINEQLSSFGIVVSSLSITNLDYNPQYKAKIAERLKMEQEIENQQSARRTAESAKLAAEAAAERRKNTMLEQVRGEQKKKVIDAQGEAAKTLKEAEAEAYRARKEGEQELEVALKEARAIEKEGLTKAEGILRMVEAYRRGGLALVREELAKKYSGTRINGKPYTLDSRIERLRIEREDAAAATAAPQKKGAGR